MPRLEVLAQTHTAWSGGARTLIWVSWLLPFPFRKKGKMPKGASSPSCACITLIITASGVNKWVSLGPA